MGIAFKHHGRTGPSANKGRIMTIEDPMALLVDARAGGELRRGAAHTADVLKGAAPG
jgi:hypothetical protein